jgi:hypothetical protein
MITLRNYRPHWPSAHTRRVWYLVGLVVVLAGISLWWNARTETETKNQIIAATVRSEAETKAATLAAAQLAIQRDDQQWCQLIHTINSGDAPPPKTGYGRSIEDALTARYKSLGCVGSNHPG